MLEMVQEYFIGLMVQFIQEIGKKILFRVKEHFILLIMEIMWETSMRTSQMDLVNKKKIKKI